MQSVPLYGTDLVELKFLFFVEVDRLVRGEEPLMESAVRAEQLVFKHHF